MTEEQRRVYRSTTAGEVYFRPAWGENAQAPYGLCSRDGTPYAAFS